MILQKLNNFLPVNILTVLFKDYTKQTDIYFSVAMRTADLRLNMAILNIKKKKKNIILGENITKNYENTFVLSD